MILKIIYLANILVAGWISITSLFFPRTAVATVFENAVPIPRPSGSSARCGARSFCFPSSACGSRGG